MFKTFSQTDADHMRNFLDKWVGKNVPIDGVDSYLKEMNIAINPLCQIDDERFEYQKANKFADLPKPASSELSETDTHFAIPSILPENMHYLYRKPQTTDIVPTEKSKQTYLEQARVLYDKGSYYTALQFFVKVKVYDEYTQCFEQYLKQCIAKNNFLAIENTYPDFKEYWNSRDKHSQRDCEILKMLNFIAMMRQVKVLPLLKPIQV